MQVQVPVMFKEPGVLDAVVAAILNYSFLLTTCMSKCVKYLRIRDLVS